MSKISKWHIPFVEYKLNKQDQSRYWVEELKRRTGRKVERTAVRLCALMDIVFLGVDVQEVKKTQEIERGIFKKRKVREEYYEKLIYNIVCKGTDEQEKQLKLLFRAAIVGMQYL